MTCMSREFSIETTGSRCKIEEYLLARLLGNGASGNTGMAELGTHADSDTGLPDFSRSNLHHHCCFSALSCRIQPGRHLVDGCIPAKRLKKRSPNKISAVHGTAEKHLRDGHGKAHSRDSGDRDPGSLQGDLRRGPSLCMP